MFYAAARGWTYFSQLASIQFFLNINMQMKDGNKPPENEQGVTLVLFNTITELVACSLL